MPPLKPNYPQRKREHERDARDNCYQPTSHGSPAPFHHEIGNGRYFLLPANRFGMQGA